MRANEVFTDEDLKRLNNYITKIQKKQIFGFNGERWDIVALLDRLEAAENVCHYVQGWLVMLNSNTDIERKLIAWRKAAGK